MMTMILRTNFSIGSESCATYYYRIARRAPEVKEGDRDPRRKQVETKAEEYPATS